jgi:23S rRNA pseudoU1915 N3-methylase RlmH
VLIREHIDEQESQRLEQWVDLARRSEIPVEGKMLHGTPFLQTIREVLRNGHDLVMITAEGRGGLKERICQHRHAHDAQVSVSGVGCQTWSAGAV